MALLPYLLDEMLSQPVRRRYGDIFDQHFGLGLLDDAIVEPSRVLVAPLRSGYLRPWRNVSADDSGVSRVTLGKEGFKVNLDVQQFKPEELSVKVADGFLVVDGKHEERSDEHGFVSRQFTRRYKIPEGVNAEALTSKLSSDGVLSLHAPPAKPIEAAGERVIPITQTNAPAVQQKKAEEKMDTK